MTEGWCTTTINAACIVEYGTRVVQKRDGGSIYPVYGGGGATFFMDTSNRADRVVVSRFGMSEECTRYVAGKFFLNDSGLTLSPRDSRSLLPEFLDRLILGLNDEIFALGKGAAQKNLDVPAFRDLRIAYPNSLTEQRRIVAILDETFEAIAMAKANTEKALQNAREVFERYLHAVFSQRGDEWVKKTVQQWVDLGVLAKPQDGNHGDIHPTKADYVDVGVPFIMAADLMSGKVDTEGCRFIAMAQASKLRIGFARSGDVLLSHKGTIGRVAILDTSNDFVILTPQVTYYRSLDRDRLFNGFLYYCLLSPEFQSAMSRIAGGGSTRAYIGITRQLDLHLTLPTIGVQREVAARLREVDETSERLVEVYQAKIAALDELKRSLLQQAFSGQLPAKTIDKRLAKVA